MYNVVGWCLRTVRSGFQTSRQSPFFYYFFFFPSDVDGSGFATVSHVELSALMLLESASRHDTFRWWVGTKQSCSVSQCQWRMQLLAVTGVLIERCFFVLASSVFFGARLSCDAREGQAQLQARNATSTRHRGKAFQVSVIT